VVRCSARGNSKICCRGHQECVSTDRGKFGVQLSICLYRWCPTPFRCAHIYSTIINTLCSPPPAKVSCLFRRFDERSHFQRVSRASPKYLHYSTNLGNPGEVIATSQLMEISIIAIPSEVAIVLTHTAQTISSLRHRLMQLEIVSSPSGSAPQKSILRLYPMEQS
jgi:hypothetical protein